MIKNIIKVIKKFMQEEIKNVALVEHTLTEADFVKSPALANNGFVVGTKVQIPETSLVEGVVVVSEEDFAQAKQALADVEAEAAAGQAAAANGTDPKSELAAAENADKELAAAKVDAQVTADEKNAEEVAAENAAKSETVQAAASVKEDPIDFIVHPRKRELANMVIDHVKSEGDDEVFSVALEEAAFDRNQANQMFNTLVENGVLEGDNFCQNCK